MSNKFRIPDNVLTRIRTRDKRCVYCGKKMVYPYVGKQRNWATIEHLNFDGPFYWDDGLRAEHIVICCGSCNSSRGIKKLRHWFTSSYCIERNINEKTVALPVRKYLRLKLRASDRTRKDY